MIPRFIGLKLVYIVVQPTMVCKQLDQGFGVVLVFAGSLMRWRLDEPAAKQVLHHVGKKYLSEFHPFVP